MPLRTVCVMTLLCVSGALLSAADATKKIEITGKGHRFFAADYDKHIMAIVAADGTIEWKREIPGSHDAWMLADGKILWTPSGDKVFEVDPKVDGQKLIYDSKTNGNEQVPVEVHGFHPNADASVIAIFESGPKRVVEVDRSGKVLRIQALPIDKGDPHHHMRNARKLDNGNYLLCLSADSKVLECDKDGKPVWEFPMGGKEPYSAIRLPNGNTLIGGGNAHRVIEVDKSGKEVWSVGETELPGIKLVWVAQVQRLTNGNTIIVNCHAGPENPQFIEVDQDKKVVWSYRDFQNFGNSLPVGFVLDSPGAIR